MKLFKNRLFLLIVSISISVLIAFVIVPVIISKSIGTVDVVRVNRIIPPNTKIEREYLNIEKVGKVNLPDLIITDPNAIVGKYAKIELLPGDNLVDAKFNSLNNIEDNFLYSLTDNNKVALSITVRSFAAGVSGMIKSGDIVSILTYVNNNPNSESVEFDANETNVITENSNKTNVIADPKLQSIEVASIDKNSDSSGDFGTITVLCTREQAILLVNAENSGSIHVVFSGRGNKAKNTLLGGDE